MALSQQEALVKLRGIEAAFFELAESDIVHVRSNSLRALSVVRQMIFNLGEFPVGILSDSVEGE